VGLLGESGCGKSITALGILRLLPRGIAVTGGDIWFEGRDLTRGGARAYQELRGTGIGYVSQEPLLSLDPTFTVGAQLGEAVRRLHRVSHKTARDAVQELLTQVRIPNPARVSRSYPHELSGGMAQRASLAMALAGRPKLLIADEPTTALDVTVQAEILELLRELQVERQMGILLVTHNWGVVADVCDRAVIMYAGETVESGSTTELFHDPLHPYTQGLLESSPALTAPGERLRSMPGRVPLPGRWPDGCRFADRCPSAMSACEKSKVSLRHLAQQRTIRCLLAEDLRREVVEA
jgi:peptide/nickel transport system permease protein